MADIRLFRNGFQLVTVEEAMPSEEMRGIPGMRDEMRRPVMLSTPGLI